MKNKDFKKLTSAEEQIMQILWKKKEAIARDIREEFPEPRPAQTTVSTIVRILEQKGFVKHKAYGRTHVYSTTISKEEYSQKYIGSVINSFFENSPKNLVSFLVEQKDINIKDLEEILNILENENK